MREIKFRGKALNREKWYYGSLIDYGDPAICDIVRFNDDNEAIHEYVDINTVGQFTGLHDKNLKDIYEGDFVRFHLHERGIHESEYQTGLVEFGGGRFYAYLDCSTLYFCGDSEDYEVIGNKWDNSELPKGGEK